MNFYLEKLMNNEDLTEIEMQSATQHCLSDSITDTEIAAFLTALRSKGETANEMTGIVHVIRSQSDLSSIAFPDIMDNCGTGGDKSYSFNVSTTTSFVIAGAGVTIAKHGNRSVSSKAGSADVLERLGISLAFSKEHIEEMLSEQQISFLYAPHRHANLKHFMRIRKELGLPTIFNMIGPLTNPISLTSQLVGVYRRDMIHTVAASLHKLGRKRAIVVNGAGYMDEASLAGPNELILLDNGDFIPFTLSPEELNMPVHSNDAIVGGNAEDNAAILLDVLKGNASPYLDTVVLNAGLGLFANGAAQSIQDGLVMAKESIKSGAAMEKLQQLIKFSKQTKSGVI